MISIRRGRAAAWNSGRRLIRTSPDGLAGSDRSRVAQSSGQQSRRQRVLGVSPGQLRSAWSLFNGPPETGENAAHA